MEILMLLNVVSYDESVLEFNAINRKFNDIGENRASFKLGFAMRFTSFSAEFPFSVYYLPEVKEQFLILVHLLRYSWYTNYRAELPMRIISYVEFLSVPIIENLVLQVYETEINKLIALDDLFPNSKKQKTE
jgi:hypothetical protein